MVNRLVPDETTRYEPSHLHLHCLCRYICWSTGLKGLKLQSKSLPHFVCFYSGGNNVQLPKLIFFSFLFLWKKVIIGLDC